VRNFETQQFDLGRRSAGAFLERLFSVSSEFWKSQVMGVTEFSV